MAPLDGSGNVKGLLAISRVIDAVNGFIGKKIAWLILAAGMAPPPVRRVAAA